MFNLPDNGDKMEVNNPPVVYSSFRPIPLISPPFKNTPPTPIQQLTPPKNDDETVSAEKSNKIQLGKPIWHSREQSPEDFWDRDYEVKEEPCQKDLDEGAIRSPFWSPISPCFPKRSASVVEEFTTLQLVETQPTASDSKLMTEHLFNAWLGTNVVIEAEWTIEPSKVCL
jgi:hypothetical protein